MTALPGYIRTERYAARQRRRQARRNEANAWHSLFGRFGHVWQTAPLPLPLPDASRFNRPPTPKPKESRMNRIEQEIRDHIARAVRFEAQAATATTAVQRAKWSKRAREARARAKELRGKGK